MGIKAVIFDFDGVLVESVDVKTQAFAEIYKDYGPGIVAQVVAYHLHHGGVSRYEKFRYYEEELLGRDFSPADRKRLGETFSRKVVEAVVASPWVAGAYDFLQTYHKQFALFIASGTPEREMIDIVERRNMKHFFAAVYGSPASKAEIIRKICDENCFGRDDALMVGDSLTDYEGAISAGIPFVGRTTGEKNVFLPDVPVIPDLTHLHSYCFSL